MAQGPAIIGLLTFKSAPNSSWKRFELMIYSRQGFTVGIPGIVCLNNIFNTVQRNSVIQHAAPKFSFAVDFPSPDI